MAVQLFFVLLLLGATHGQCDSSAELEEFARNNRIFTAAFYKESVKQSPGNLLISPLSTETAFALALSGAQSSTADEIRTGLHFPPTTAQTEALFSHLPSLFNDSAYRLTAANRIYVSRRYPIRSEYLGVANSVYGAAAENVDFADANIANTINEWVSQQTGGKIKAAVEPSTIDGDTTALIVNAVYFKAAWRQIFKKQYVQRYFHADGAAETVLVDAMTQLTDYNYEDDAELGAKFLEMPFEGSNVSMVIAMPYEIDGLATLQQRIDGVIAARNFTLTKIKLFMPKFQMGSRVNLKTALQGLGVQKAFEANVADFSNLAGKEGDFKIDEALQKTFIQVAEGGVEAAAVSALGYNRFSAPLNPPHIRYVVDRPFIFYLQVKGVVIFIGHVTNPLSTT